MSSFNVGEVLSALKQVARETGADGKENDTKASRQQSASWNQSLEAVRHEFVGKLEQALALQQDLQQLLTLEAGLQAQSAMLAERLATVEDQSASLQSQLNQQSADVSQQVQNQVTLAANTHFEEHLQHLEQERLGPLVQAELRRQVQQWAASELAAVVQHEVQRQTATAVQTALSRELQALQAGTDAVQQACVGTAELASQVASEVASLAADMQHLSGWCQRLEAAHSNHEERLCLLEESAAETAAAAPSAPVGAATAVGYARQRTGNAVQQHELTRLDGAMRQQEERLSRLELAAGVAGKAPPDRGSRPASAATPPAAAPAALRAASTSPQEAGGSSSPEGEAQLGGSPQQLAQQQATLAAQLAAAEVRLGALLGETRAELAAQQVQRAQSTDEVVHAVLTDVMSLARHTKALDGEVRALRGGVAQLQDAVLQCSSTFATALKLPSPVGPFTSFPPA
ncbi:hypothetical protein N2152v2_008346 [Parachlorella kessleri]